MPELPEVETTTQGIAPHLLQQHIVRVEIRNASLRWPIPDDIQLLVTQRILAVERRAKYIFIKTAVGYAMIHLGMSGSLRVLDTPTTPEKHDHWDITLANNTVLRYTDPRRFGAFLWAGQEPHKHQLITDLGPEPLSLEFTAEYFWQRSRSRKLTVKQFIMDGKVVVGVGNIYASETLFLAGVLPQKPAGALSRKQCTAIVDAAKTVLANAIAAGGTTLKDFSHSDGKPGYFKIELNVYGRAEQHCKHCPATIHTAVQGQRATYWCPSCQS